MSNLDKIVCITSYADSVIEQTIKQIKEDRGI